MAADLVVPDPRKCVNCASVFMGKGNQRFCNYKCSSTYIKKRKTTYDLPTGTIGAMAELVVSVDLMKQGYDVFRALSPSCDCDILAIRDGELHKYEVRTGQYYENNNGGIKIIYGRTRIKGKLIAVVTHVDGKVHYFGEEGELGPQPRIWRRNKTTASHMVAESMDTQEYISQP